MENDPGCHTERAVCLKEQFSPGSSLEGIDAPQFERAVLPRFKP